MNLKEFLKEIKTDLEVNSVKEITLETNLYSLEEWDSLNLLILIDLIKTNFDVSINPDEFKGDFKVKDLIEKIETLSDGDVFE